MLLNEIYFKKLIKPISEQKPCGEYLKTDRTKYRPLRNAFNQAKTSMKMIIDNNGLDDTNQLNLENINHWSELSEQCINSLENDTKDIEVLGWLITSQFILDKSLLGFYLSIKLLNTLLQNYWNIINPILSKDLDINQQDLNSIRIRFLSQIFGESNNSGLLFMPLRLTPVVGSFTLGDYLKSKEKNQLIKMKSDLKKNLSFNIEDIKEKKQNLNNAIIELKSIYNFITEKFNTKTLLPPPAIKSTIKEVSEIQSAIAFIFDLEERIKDVNEFNSETPLTSISNSKDTNIVSSSLDTLSQSAITNREQAFQQLYIILNYFKTHEPHNPISFLLTKCIRWGQLSLPELLKEWFKDGQASIDNIFNLAGFNDVDKNSPAASSSSEESPSSKEKGKSSSIFD